MNATGDEWISSDLCPHGVKVPRLTLWQVYVKRGGVWRAVEPILPADATLDVLRMFLDDVRTYEDFQVCAIHGEKRLFMAGSECFDLARTETESDFSAEVARAAMKLVAERIPATQMLLGPMLSFLGGGPKRVEPLDEIARRWGLRRPFTLAQVDRARKSKVAAAHPDKHAGDRTQWQQVAEEYATLRSAAK